MTRTLLPALLTAAAVAAAGHAQDKAFTIPLIDLDHQDHRHVVVDREKGEYLGHPSTLLLEDGKTILCVYPKGHGRGAIVYKKSADCGKSWSERLPTPKSWETSQETPTLHRVIDATGKKRIILFSGLHPVRMAVSEDNGVNWSELKPVGSWGGIVAMSSVIELTSGPGRYLALFHDDGRFIAEKGMATGIFTLYQTLSQDGGLTWSVPAAIYRSSAVHLCEPGAFRSPDGKQIAVLLRENRRLKNSHVIFSADEGKTWTEPREVPASLTGDRHVARYGPDGRLVISFRDVPRRGTTSPTRGDWVAWVGRYADIVDGGEGQYRVRFKDNKHGWDCAYPGVELLPDGTFVVTTYGHWAAGEPPYIMSVRFTLKELDELARQQPAREASQRLPGSDTSGHPRWQTVAPRLQLSNRGAVMSFGTKRLGPGLLVAGLLLSPFRFTDLLVQAEEPAVEPRVRSLVSAAHVEGVFSVAFSPDGRHLASGGDEGEVVIWDAVQWRELRKLPADSAGRQGHFEDVWGVAFSPDGKRLATASHDETVRIWDVETGNQLRVLRGHSFHVWGVAFSPDGKRLASAGGASDSNGQFAAGEVKIWDPETGQGATAMRLPAARVYDVAFSPDGKSLASAWEDKSVRVWDAATGQQRLALQGHAGEVRVVTWSPDGKQLASGSDDRTVRLWDAGTGKELRVLRGYHGVAYSADGKLLAAGGAAGVGVWDAVTGKQVRTLMREMTFSRLALSPNGTHVVWDSGPQTLKVWTPAD